MTTTTLTSREANQDFSRAKRALKTGPVVITERGKPALVLLKYEDYQQLIGKRANILDALRMPGMEDIEFEPPPRSKELPRDIDLS